MLVIVAQQDACGADILVARLMAQRIVDLFQPVHIAYDDRERIRLSFRDLRLHLPLPHGEGVLALDAGEGIGKGDGSGVVPLLGGFFLPLHGGGVVDDHDEERQDEQTADGDGAEAVCVVQLPALDVKKRILVHGKHIAVRRALHIVGDLVDDDVFSRFVCPFGPGQRHQDNEGEQGDPHDNGFTEISGVILADDAVEEEQPQNRPDRHQDIGLRFNGIVGKRAGKNQEDHEYEQDDQADAADHAVCFAALPTGLLENRRGSEAVKDGGAEGGGVHDPSDRRSPDKGDGQRDKDDQHDRLNGDLFFVEVGIALGQNAVLGHRIAQTAESAQIADEARDHQRQQGRHQDIDARVPEIMVRGIESGQPGNPVKFIQAPDIIKPAAAPFGICRDAHQNDEDVQRRGDDQRDHQNAKHPAVFEVILRRGMGNAFKADKGPRGNERDAHDLAKGALVRNKGGLH